jgi:uncharacterized protein
MPKVTALHIYPVKGCAGIEVSGVRLDARGPWLDRRFMVVDEHARFVSQRELPRMALIRTKITPTALLLEAAGMPKLQVSLATQSDARKRVEIWNDALPAEPVGASASAWLSDLLGARYELVRFADEAQRPVDPRYAPADSRVGFADAFPLLLLSEASLAALNARLPQRIPMDRFRPNIVLDDCEPHAEDGYRELRIGEVRIDVVKPCSRCSVPTVDQRSAEIGKEPSATLARYRRKGNHVYFGQNCIHRELGMIRVGDAVEVLSTQEPWSFD